MHEIRRLLNRTWAGSSLHSSPLVRPEGNGRRNRFVRSTIIGRNIKKRLIRCGINARAYDLRTYFDTQMLIAERRRLILRDYRVFFMGHTGDIEHRYTLNRHNLPPELVNDLRKCYEESSSRFLETRSLVSRDAELGPAEQVRLQLLLVSGFGEEEIREKNLLDLSASEVTQIIKERLLRDQIGNEEMRQRTVSLDELEDWLKKGYRLVQALETRNQVIIEPRAISG